MPADSTDTVLTAAFFDAPVACLVWDGDGRILWMNRRARALLGALDDWAQGQPLLEAFADDALGKAKAEALFQRFLAGEPIEGEAVSLRGDGGAPLRTVMSASRFEHPETGACLAIALLQGEPDPGAVEGTRERFPHEPPEAQVPEPLSRRLWIEREAERGRVEASFRDNIERMLLPLLTRARSTADARTRDVLDAAHKALLLLTEPYGSVLTARAPSLTPREIEVCALVRCGLASKEIGAILGISHRSVETHRTRVRRKLGMEDAGQDLASYLIHLTIIDGEAR
ncbi:MAG: LuxR C-terminal-related transcriptional regulator [Pseudomonadota bacterium]